MTAATAAQSSAAGCASTAWSYICTTIRADTSGKGESEGSRVAEDDHLLAVLCYIERNPVRASLVERAHDWLPFEMAPGRAEAPQGRIAVEACRARDSTRARWAQCNQSYSFARHRLAAFGTVRQFMTMRHMAKSSEHREKRWRSEEGERWKGCYPNPRSLNQARVVARLSKPRACRAIR
jgi:hypothetical protein